MANNDLVPELTKSEFDNFTKEGLVLIDFFAEWCMPCLTMIPIIEEISEKFKGKVKFGKIDVSEHQDIAQKFGVMSIPNFVLLKNGKLTEQIMGAIPQEDLEKILQKHL